MIYIFNLFGIFINFLISLLKGSPVENPLLAVTEVSGFLPSLIISVIVAPIMEELIFRKILISKLRIYGEGLCILASGFIFAMFHANLSQLFYAFPLGALFAYVYLRTGKIIYPIILHMMINFPGIIGAYLTGLPIYDNLLLQILTAVYGYLIIGIVITGVVIIIKHRSKIHLNYGALPLRENEKRGLLFGNAGMIAYILITTASIVYIVLY